MYTSRKPRRLLALLFSVSLFASCGNGEDPLWYSTRTKGLPTGFYLCRNVPAGQRNGYPDPGSPIPKLLSASTNLTLENVDTVYREIQPDGTASLHIRWTAAGAQQFEAFTERCFGQVIALLHGDRILSAPQVQDVISGRDISLYGDYSEIFLRGFRDSVQAARLRASRK